MNNPLDHVDASLVDWNDIKDQYDWSGLLVGNGASRAVWEDFGYASLYEKAKSKDIQHRLTSADKSIFKSMKTKDFERVLAALWTTETVCKALGKDLQKVSEHYQSIQRALIEAVHSVHLRWYNQAEGVFKEIRSALLQYKSVYSTNYDLLLYWAIMSEDRPSHKDYFWSGLDSTSFDITNTVIYGESHRILYLHGALHLIRLPYGSGTMKLTSSRGDLLSQFGRNLNPGETSLFVTEGTAQDKLTAIRSSDYLSFAYEQFVNHRDRLVVFGHSFGESDEHLLAAIKQWENCTIAISLRPGETRTVMANKTRLLKQLPNAQIFFYNAETHPLGKPSLKITQNGDNDL